MAGDESDHVVFERDEIIGLHVQQVLSQIERRGADGFDFPQVHALELRLHPSFCGRELYARLCDHNTPVTECSGSAVRFRHCPATVNAHEA
jgi:hypothetical protein